MNSSFTFTGYQLDKKKGIATFSYTVKNLGKTYQFLDRIFFPVVNAAWEKIPSGILENILNSLLLILGISYWRLFCPKIIRTPTVHLSKGQAEFWNTVYTKGLGEFFYKNKIDYRRLVEFPYDGDGRGKGKGENKRENALPLKRSLLFFGGGKDSIVSAKLLQAHHKLFSLFMVNDSNIQRETANLIDSERIVFERKLDPQIFELNKEPGVYNGHIPISAIWAFLGAFAGILYDYQYVVTSNEHSANYGNVSYLGNEMNHQWSKSYEFETLFQTYIQKYITENVTYFSLLRPLYEIKIAQIFTKYQEFFPYFSSCNRNFRIKNYSPGRSHGFAVAQPTTFQVSHQQWCGACAKCLFVFILLAAFLPKNELMKIFGKDLLDDPKLLSMLKELLGLERLKPFDCVGTPEETKLALFYAHEKEEYENTLGMELFTKEILPNEDFSSLEKKLLSIGNENNIPEEFREVI